MSWRLQIGSYRPLESTGRSSEGEFFWLLLFLGGKLCRMVKGTGSGGGARNFTPKIATIIKNPMFGASLVAQWLRVCLPMQGTRVRALVWEDPTCRGATGPVSHSY